MKILTHYDPKPIPIRTCDWSATNWDANAVLLMEAKRAHAVSKLPEYVNWSQMNSRCYNERNKNYSSYGGRGVTVWLPWRTSFEMFFLCVGPRHEAGTQIDRINNAGNYEPSNVRWATSVQQSRNRRNIKPITAFGRTMLLTDWGRETGISIRTILSRITQLGWDAERALSEPPQKQIR